MANTARWNGARLRTRQDMVLAWVPSAVSCALDAGCSTGEITAALAAHAVTVRGFDPDEGSVAIARGRYPQIPFEVQNLERTPLSDESFDLIVCADVFEHVSDELASARELIRLLRPGGTLILSTPHRGMFACLDPANTLGGLRHIVSTRLPRLHQRQRAIRRREASPIERKLHRHYSVRELRDILSRAAPHAQFEVTGIYRSGLVLYPVGLTLIVIVNFLAPRAWRPHLTRLFNRVVEWDYGRDYGRAAYNVALRLVKQP